MENNLLRAYLMAATDIAINNYGGLFRDFRYYQDSSRTYKYIKHKRGKKRRR